jgi:HAD superfamily hydrolase (TIGR01509 family)
MAAEQKTEQKNAQRGKACFQPRAVILDMDGLMLDTERPIIDLWVKAGRSCGWEIRRESVIQVIGINRASSFAVFRNEYGADFPYDEIHTGMQRLMMEAWASEGIRCRPGLIDLLDCLAEQKIPFAVATSTDRKTARWKLERAGILGLFSLLICGDEIERGKPAPDIFLAAARGLGAAPADCVGFEDSAPGLMGLQAAGIRSVFVKDLPEPPPEVLAGVWRRYGDLAEAREIFTV